jgi:hypothetical protein
MGAGADAEITSPTNSVKKSQICAISGFDSLS